MLVIKLIGMLYAKLSALSRSINNLRVVIVPLGVYLLTAYSFIRKDASLLLINHFLLTSVRSEVSLYYLGLFETFQALLSWGDDSFLWILRTDIVILVSFRAGNSICSWSNCRSLILINKLKLLLSSLILILNHLFHPLSIFIKRNLYSTIRITYVKTWVIILLKTKLLLTLVALLWNSGSEVILCNLFKSATI